MTRFQDGPAAGVVLPLRRAPLFLRVVRAADGTFDALDQLHDVPRPTETIHVYRLAEPAGSVHVCSRDRKTGRHTGGTFAVATYTHLAEQPPDEVTRNTSAWRAWAEANRTMGGSTS